MKRQILLDEPVTAYEKVQRARVEYYAKKMAELEKNFGDIYEDERLPDECYLEYYFNR